MSITPPSPYNRSIIDTICYRLVNSTRYIINEEQTKTHLILPFIQGILGYSDPENLRPEDVADIVTRNQRKVDYALYGPNNDLRIVIECKALNVTLDEQHAVQLQEYFLSTTSQIGILTNGIEWRFYLGEDRTNRMSTRPFMSFDVTNMTKKELAVIKLMSLDTYDYDLIHRLETITSTLNDIYSKEQIDSIIVDMIRTKFPFDDETPKKSGDKKNSVKTFGNISDLIASGMLSADEKLHVTRKRINGGRNYRTYPVGTIPDDFQVTIIDQGSMLECNGIREKSPSPMVSTLTGCDNADGYAYLYVVRDNTQIPLNYIRKQYAERNGHI